MTATAELQGLKDRHRATWHAGDYEAVADALVLQIGRRIVARLPLGPQAEVLDVAAGTGNAAIPAAATGARVIALDLVPSLLASGRRRAAAAGVDVEWIEGDAEDLPFADDRFDVVISTLGVQFTPRHEASASELVRVCRPGGTIGLANWTPQGYIGQFFKTLSPYMPPLPEGASPPPLWGDQAHVERLFAGTGVTLEFQRGTADFNAASPDAFITFMETHYGPLVKAREALGDRWPELRADLVALSERMNDASDGFHVASEYLEVIGRVAG